MARVVALATILSAAVAVEPSPLFIPTMEIGTDIQGQPVLMPMAGIGTWLYNDTVVADEVATALKIGARLVDTAWLYHNQKGVAQGIKNSGVPRDSLFITTKVRGGTSTADTIAEHDSNLADLEMDTVDLLLAHYPCAFNPTPGKPPLNCSKEARQATWKGLEAIYKAGKARAIGISHYCQKHIEDILEIATVKISVNQEEWHVGMGPDPEGLVSFGKKHGISYQSFSPLCGPCGNVSHKELFDGPLVTTIGKNHNVSGAQVALRWLVENGSPVISKSHNPVHIKSNLDLFHFSFTPDEFEQLNAATSPASAEPVSADCKLDTTIVV